MVRKHFTIEQIINMLRETEVILSQATPIAQACKKLGISEQSYYHWRKEYDGLRTDQTKKLREVLKENARFKKVVGDLVLDNDILREGPREGWIVNHKRVERIWRQKGLSVNAYGSMTVHVSACGQRIIIMFGAMIL